MEVKDLLKKLNDRIDKLESNQGKFEQPQSYKFPRPLGVEVVETFQEHEVEVNFIQGDQLVPTHSGLGINTLLNNFKI